jgi:LemA protein
MTPIILVALLLVVIGTIIYFIGIYNGLIRLSKSIDKAWSNIGVLLKQRHDEIPKLIKVCEGYMKYEKETLRQITDMRAQCMRVKSVGDTSQAENHLSGLLGGLFAVAENYPELKSNEHFTKLQERISYLESQIADRREFYNDSVNSYNIRIAQIPDLFVARAINMQQRDLFETADEDKKDVDIQIQIP